jgi:UDP-N-acetylmuramoyl-L-alanyl-D-glutamate--2,6-diaminopimelate ligase
MPLLKDILYKVSLLSVSGTTDLHVEDICFDSRKVKKGDVFVAVKGTAVDGHAFIQTAVDQGAIAIVAEHIPADWNEAVPLIQVADSAKALGIMSSNFFGNPSSKLALVAITGTNGKTTTVTLLFQLFRSMGYATGLLSTVHNQINEDVIPATHTTPDALSLNKLLAEMVKRGVTHCFMEASSHAIVQERMAGLQLAGAVFTNITHDHLDYHKTFDEYIKAKKKLFDELPSSAFALTNVDDKRGQVMLQNTKARKATYGLKSVCEFKGKVLSNTFQGLEIEIDNTNVWFMLIGDFNAYNLLAAYGVAILLEEPQDEVLTNLSSVKSAQGRFEIVIPGAEITGIVDYAHTPDALENVLKTIANIRTGNEKVITVVGCGGNRDKAKRPIMADIASKWSEKVILTSDNPRDEDPDQIIREMQAGVSASHTRKVLSIADRKEAIKTAVSLANPGDIILVAGKGHETYQEIKGVKYDFDDRKTLSEIIRMIFG